MTKKAFAYALERGLGRCVIAARENPEKYKNMILRACQRCQAFDPQCEGTRSWYMHELISCCEDKEVFVQLLCEKLLKQKSTGSWDMQYFSEILCYFADDGFAMAREALWKKYDQLYEALLNKKRAPQGFFHERDDFEMLCITLSNDFDNYLRIAKDIGTLYLTKPFYSGFDFEWLYDSREKQYNRRLAARAKNSAQVQCYLEMAQKYEKAIQERLKNRANIQRPAEREFAMQVLNSDFENVFPILVKNYQPEHKAMLETMVAHMKIDRADESNWHHVHLTILDLFDKEKGIQNPPKNILPIIYETTLCSCCREQAVSLMRRYRMLSQEMLAECPYDSNSDIREGASHVQ